MLRMILPYVLIFISVLGTYSCVELVHDHKWKDVLPYLNIKNFQETRSSVFATTNNTICAQHFQVYMDQISTSNWAMLMFDSSTKFPESVLMGQSVFLGNFDECIEVEHVDTGVGVFSGQHCLAEFLQDSDSVQTLSPQVLPHIESPRIRAPNIGGNDRTAAFDLSSLGLTLSYCIPSTCSAKDFEGIFNSYLQDMDLPLMISVAEEYCQTNEGKSLATEDWITAGILFAYSQLIVISTAYDLMGKGQKKELLLTFSVYSNGKKLLSTKTSGDTLQALHGIRFITICWVILGHRYLMDMAVPSINLGIAVDFFRDPGRLYVTNSTLSVDTFFVLSGLLVAYIFLKQMKHNKSGFNIPMFYVHRYIRLTPPYAIVIVITATLYRYVGSGPLFPAYANQMAEDCQSNWWTNILYINNYFDRNHMCVSPSWYLAVDMQLFLLSPIVLYPLWKWPRNWNILLLGILAIGGVVSPFAISYVNDLSATFLIENQLAAGFLKAQLYYATYSRFGPWIIGVIFGYLVYEAKRKELKLSLIHITAGWILSIVAMLASLDGIISFYQSDAGKTILESAFYNGLFRNVWAFGVGVTIFLCVTGYGGPVNTLLSWKAIIPLSRLTYCVYLTHINYQVVKSFSARTSIYIADLTELPTFLSDVIISLILAAILSLGIEVPAMNLEKHLLGRGRKTKQNNTEEVSPQTQEERDKAYKNKLTEESVALEEGIHNITEVIVKDPREESVALEEGIHNITEMVGKDPREESVAVEEGIHNITEVVVKDTREESVALEEGIHNITEVVVKDTREESIALEEGIHNITEVIVKDTRVEPVAVEEGIHNITEVVVKDPQEGSVALEEGIHNITEVIVKDPWEESVALEEEIHNVTKWVVKDPWEESVALEEGIHNITEWVVKDPWEESVALEEGIHNITEVVVKDPQEESVALEEGIHSITEWVVNDPREEPVALEEGIHNITEVVVKDSWGEEGIHNITEWVVNDPREEPVALEEGIHNITEVIVKDPREESVALEEGIHNNTEVVVKDPQEDSMGYQIKD